MLFLFLVQVFLQVPLQFNLKILCSRGGEAENKSLVILGIFEIQGNRPMYFMMCHLQSRHLTSFVMFIKI